MVTRTVTCACGHSYQTASTRASFQVEICANCHPFYTGRQKLVDAAGRIERFQRRYGRKSVVEPVAPAARLEARSGLYAVFSPRPAGSSGCTARRG